MNHQAVYDALIQSRQANASPGEYHEKHHIVPRSLGGSDAPENIVRLTPREHYLAHWLLAKIHGGKMWMALTAMSMKNGNTRKRADLSSSVYAEAKEKAYRHKSESMAGRGNHFYGRRHTQQSRDLISVARVGSRIGDKERQRLSAAWAGDKNPRYGKGHAIEGSKNPFYGKRHSAESIEKMRRAAQGRKVSPRLGKQHSEATKGKIAANWGKKTVDCPHCQKRGDSRAMKRWHFDNCKHR